MPLVRRRCRACTLPLADPPYASLPARCARCGASHVVAVAADGQPADFVPAFSGTRLLAWLHGARASLTSGAPGVAIGACEGCGGPLTVSPDQAVSLPCPHCGEIEAGAAGDLLVDQWTEPWTRVQATGLELEYRLIARALEETSPADPTLPPLPIGCPVCGTPNDPKAWNACSHCRSALWIVRDGRPMQLGLRIDGTRNGAPFDGVIPITQGESVLRADAIMGASSGGSALRATAVGCGAAITIGLVLVGIVAAVIFAHS